MTQTIHLYNTLSAKKEVYKERLPGQMNFYGCGPTVYGLIHVGNARAFICQDLVIRIFKLAGYQVKFARNITDIDDKIIKVANDTGRSAQDVAESFTESFVQEMNELGITPPDILPKATEHIPEILEMIQGLIGKGLAYVAETPFGSDVYYRVDKFKNYGALSKRATDDLVAGARIEPGEQKENPIDFALWKAAKPGEPSWTSPWGEGRPGWHIECSAMIYKHFPKGIDIHAGGLDLIFPHHENEIAQSEGFCDCKLANYWVHTAMLTFGKEKMSKSLGNIVTSRQFLNVYGSEVLRLLVLQHHYRSPIDFSDEAICRSEGLLERLYHCKQKALEAGFKANQVLASDLPPDLAQLEKQITESLFDDFNSAKALGFILKAARLCFREEKADYWKAWGVSLNYFDSIYGLLHAEPVNALKNIKTKRLQRMGVTETFAKQIDDRLTSRETLRAQKRFQEADDVRKQLESEGILVMDGPDGSTWAMKNSVS